MTRPSKRELESTVEEVTDAGDYPEPSLAILLSYDVERVAGRPELLRIDGQLYQRPDIDGLRFG